jgi:hypothetical protein
MYLTLYPPSEFAVLESAATTSRPTGAPTGHDQTEPIPDRRAGSNEGWSDLPSRESHAETQHIALFLGTGLLAALLTLSGLGFTFWEFKRLASKTEDRISFLIRGEARSLSYLFSRPEEKKASGRAVQ